MRMMILYDDGLVDVLDYLGRKEVSEIGTENEHILVIWTNTEDARDTPKYIKDGFDLTELINDWTNAGMFENLD